jgi:hypothetical protein
MNVCVKHFNNKDRKRLIALRETACIVILLDDSEAFYWMSWRPGEM